MSRVRVRAIEPTDTEQINQLHLARDDAKSAGDAEKRTQMLEWLAFHNPYARDEATYYVAEDAGRIVAFEGRMPVEFIINGTRAKGYYVHDTYVHPDYRKKGLGFSLVNSLAETIEKQSDSFFCVLGGTPLNLKIQRRMGYHELPPAPVCVKLLNPRMQMSKLIRVPLLVKLLNPLGCRLLSLIDILVMRLHTSSLIPIPIDRFDHRFDELMNRVSDKLGICSYKGADYLNWKYVDRPFNKNQILVLEEEARVVGFVVLASVLKSDCEGGCIMEMVADPYDKKTVAALCHTSVEYFRKQNAHFILCVLTDRRFREVLRQFLFLRVGSGKAILLGNMERINVDNDYLTDTEKWHVTLGESDTLILSDRMS